MPALVQNPSLLKTCPFAAFVSLMKHGFFLAGSGRSRSSSGEQLAPSGTQIANSAEQPVPNVAQLSNSAERPVPNVAQLNNSAERPGPNVAQPSKVFRSIADADGWLRTNWAMLSSLAEAKHIRDVVDALKAKPKPEKTLVKTSSSLGWYSRE